MGLEENLATRHFAIVTVLMVGDFARTTPYSLEELRAAVETRVFKGCDFYSVKDACSRGREAEAQRMIDDWLNDQVTERQDSTDASPPPGAFLDRQVADHPVSNHERARRRLTSLRNAQ